MVSDTAERMYKNCKSRQDDIQEDYGNVNQFAMSLGWANLWKKTLKKPQVQLCSTVANMFPNHVASLWRPDSSPLPAEIGAKQKYIWERGQLD